MSSKTPESRRATGPRTPQAPERRVFDTTPLSVFARVGRLDLLENRYRDGALWTVEVRDELRRGAEKYPDLSEVLDAGWLPEPIRMTTPAELRGIEHLRWALGGSTEDRLKHLGEAATIVAADAQDAVAVLDDGDARRLADARGVAIIGTLGILKACVQDDELSPDGAWGIFQEMVALRFYFPPHIDRAYFDG